MEALIQLMNGFGTALAPMNLAFAAIGVMLGTAVGVLPGIGPAMTLALRRLEAAIHPYHQARFLAEIRRALEEVQASLAGLHAARTEADAERLRGLEPLVAAMEAHGYGRALTERPGEPPGAQPGDRGVGGLLGGLGGMGAGRSSSRCACSRTCSPSTGSRRWRTTRTPCSQPCAASRRARRPATRPLCS